MDLNFSENRQEVFDFSTADNQISQVYGPVPSGSKVLTQLFIKEPKYPSMLNSVYGQPISQRRSGMQYINCQIVVQKGTYEGVKFFQDIPLPFGVQT